jgi:ankyrin repeat protein
MHNPWMLICSSFDSDKKLEAIRKMQQNSVDSGPNTTKHKALLLHYVAANSDISIDVIKAVTSPAAVRCKDANNRVPLHWAAMHSRSVEMLEYLLAEWPGATKAQDKEGYTPLHRLIDRFDFSLPEQAAMIECLVDADPESCGLRTNEGHTAFQLYCHRPVKDENAECIFLKVLTACPSVVSQRTEDGQVPLHRVSKGSKNSEKNNYLPIEPLLAAYKEGASVMDDRGRLPAHWAVDTGGQGQVAVDRLKLLLDAYPQALSPEANKVENMVSMAAISLCDSTLMLKYLLQRSPELARIADSSGTLPLHRAAERGRLKSIELLYESYPEAIKKFTSDGYLVLHLIIRYGINDPLSSAASTVRFFLRHFPEAVGMRQSPQEPGDVDGVADVDRRRPIMKRTPYQLSVRNKSSEYIQRILLRACPAADPQRLREMNYKERRLLMFLAFAACAGANDAVDDRNISGRGLKKRKKQQQANDESDTDSGINTTMTTTSSDPSQFIYQLRRLMNIGEDLGLLRHIASFL